MEAHTVETTEQVVAPTTSEVLKQKEAVYHFVNQALEGTDVTVAQLKDVSVKTAAKKAVLKQVRVNLFHGFRNGTVKISKQKSDGELKKYCSIITCNWLRKDKRFF